MRGSSAIAQHVGGSGGISMTPEMKAQFHEAGCGGD